MVRAAPAFVVLLVVCAGGPSTIAGAGQSADCSAWQDCRAQAEQALAGEAFERALDLAWRSVQRGPKEDPALMFLLARAQTLAGRPHDALVMVRRLAERGIATEAATHPDLERMRALPGWSGVEPLVAGVNAGAPAEPSPPPAAEPSAEAGRAGRSGSPAVDRNSSAVKSGGPEPGTAAGAAAGAATAAVVEETVRLSRDRFATAGLAYDAVSHRFVIGDRDGRKVRVVGEGLDEAVDLVRAESAGFSSIRSLAIDARRGDLWVASADRHAGSASLHRLQLISGRPLKAYVLDGGGDPLWPVDVAVTAAGAVLVLDAAGRVVRLKPGAESAQALAVSGLSGATTIATGSSEGHAYVAHPDGIVRVNLSSGSTTALTAPDGVSLAGFRRLRAHRDGVVGLRADGDGALQLVRLRFSSGATRVRSATVFDVRIGATGDDVALAVTGDEVAVVGEAPDAGSSPNRASPPPTALVVRRLRLP